MAMKTLPVAMQTSSLQVTRSNAAQVAGETTGIDTSDVNRNRDASRVSPKVFALTLYSLNINLRTPRFSRSFLFLQLSRLF